MNNTTDEVHLYTTYGSEAANWADKTNTAGTELVNNNDVFPSYTPAVNTEGVQYAYYKGKVRLDTSNDPIQDIYKTRAGADTSGDSDSLFWWLRSPNIEDSLDFLLVTNYGCPGGDCYASYASGVAPAFCM